MNVRLAALLTLAVLAAFAVAQQPAAPAAAPAAAAKPAFIIFKIELNPTGTMFAAGEPVLEGDTYVFTSLPEKQTTRLRRSNVKSVERWSSDPAKEVLWKIDILPSGSYYSRDEPVRKGPQWVAHGWKQGQLYSLPATDVVKITKIEGREAYITKMKELGVVLLEGSTTEAGFKGGNAPVNVPQGSNPQGGQQGQGNWTYQGQPGATDAYAPAGGTVAKPGDTPMMPTPQ